MVPREARRGSSFVGCGRYYLHDKHASTSERVSFAHTENLPTNDPHKAMKWMAWTALNAEVRKRETGASLTGRKSQKPVYTFSLSWHPEQDPAKWDMIKAGRQALTALGLTEHETVMVAHNDCAYNHLHVIVNLIHPDTGKANSVSFSKKKLSLWAEQYENNEGKIYCDQRVDNNARRAEGEYVKYEEPVHDLKARITNLFRTSDTPEAFQQALAENGLRLAQGKRLLLIDETGKIHSLARQIEGIKEKELRRYFSEVQLAEAETVREQMGLAKEPQPEDNQPESNTPQQQEAPEPQSENAQGANASKEEEPAEPDNVDRIDEPEQGEQDKEHQRSDGETSSDTQTETSGQGVDAETEALEGKDAEADVDDDLLMQEQEPTDRDQHGRENEHDGVDNQDSMSDKEAPDSVDEHIVDDENSKVKDGQAEPHQDSIRQDSDEQQLPQEHTDNEDAEQIEELDCTAGTRQDHEPRQEEDGDPEESSDERHSVSELISDEDQPEDGSPSEQCAEEYEDGQGDTNRKHHEPEPRQTKSDAEDVPTDSEHTSAMIGEDADYWDRDQQDRDWQEAIIDAALNRATDEPQPLSTETTINEAQMSEASPPLPGSAAPSEDRTTNGRESNRHQQPEYQTKSVSEPVGATRLNALQDRHHTELGTFYSESTNARFRMEHQWQTTYGEHEQQTRHQLEGLETTLRDSGRLRVYWLKLSGQIPRNAEQEVENLRKTLEYIEWRKSEQQQALEAEIHRNQQILAAKQEQERRELEATYKAPDLNFPPTPNQTQDEDSDEYENFGPSYW